MEYKAAVLGIVSSVLVLVFPVHAEPLVEFSNGAVADAEDVNSNFQELEARIEKLSSTTINGNADTIKFSDYMHNYATKTFSVTGNDRIFVDEIWDFTEDGKIKVTRKPNLTTWGSIADKLGFITGRLASSYTDIIEQKPNGERVLVKRENNILNADLSTVIANIINYEPGIVLNKGDMFAGQAFNTTGTAKLTGRDGVTKIALTNPGYFINTTTPVEFEAVTIGDKEYTDCIKMETRRSSQHGLDSNFHKVSWYCRGEGLVKELRLYNQLNRLADATDFLKSTAIANPRGELLQLTSSTDKN